MYYRNGREAKSLIMAAWVAANGDKVVQIGGYGTGAEIVAVGVLHDAVAGNDYCNGSLAPIPASTGACLIDSLHVDDLAAILAERGLDKRPAGK